MTACVYREGCHSPAVCEAEDCCMQLRPLTPPLPEPAPADRSTIELDIPETAAERVALEDANRECQCPKCGRLHRKLSSNPPDCIREPAPAEGQADRLIAALLEHHQCDEDGVMCIVSRQACVEAAAEIDRLRQEVADEERESEHYLRLAFVDAGANPPVTWKERAEQAEAQVAQMRAALEGCVATYDAYRARGVLPAPDEYGAWIRSVDVARAALSALPQREAEPS